MIIMQGDAYGIPLGITIDGVPATPQTIGDLEVAIGSQTKRYSDGGLIYADDCGFVWPMAQSDSFALKPMLYKVQARVKLLSGSVVGIGIGTIDVRCSQSREVL